VGVRDSAQVYRAKLGTNLQNSWTPLIRQAFQNKDRKPPREPWDDVLKLEPRECFLVR